MGRLAGLPDRAFIEELKQLRIDLNDLKKDQLIKQNRLNVATKGTVDLNANATAGIPIVVTVPHPPSIVNTPIPLVYFNFAPGQYSPLPNSTAITTAGVNIGLNNWSFAATDETNLYITFISGTTNDWGIYTYNYYLLQESAA